MNIIKLSKLLSYLLRHAPEEASIKLDERGSIDIDILIEHLKLYQNVIVSKDEIFKLSEPTDKVRFEIEGNLIRALNGHSKVKVEKESIIPPDILYHGTYYQTYYNFIRNDGIKSMDRQYVHMSADKQTANKVALRHGKIPYIILIDAKAAYNDGVLFYKGNDETFLTDFVHPKYFISDTIVKSS